MHFGRILSSWQRVEDGIGELTVNVSNIFKVLSYPQIYPLFIADDESGFIMVFYTYGFSLVAICYIQHIIHSKSRMYCHIQSFF